MSVRFVKPGIALGALGLLLAGCASPEGVTVSDPWVKATDSSMSALFATLENTESTGVTLVAASADFAPTVEIHEVVDGVMREKSEGVTLPAGTVVALEPGADHVMLMGLSEELAAGDTVTISLEFSDGSFSEVEALVKDYAGANEEYDPHHSEGMGAGE